jgi:glycosyltransferase involved in cell wall biosynthesis
MNNKPEITIVVPVYNYERFLEETLESVRAQEFSNWEAIIVNDGSTDQSESIASHFVSIDQRFRYIYQQNGGLSAARNTGIEAAKGQYIQLLDADDLISAKKLSRQYDFMQSRRDVDISYTNAIYFKEDNPAMHYKSFGISENAEPILSNREWIPNFDDKGIKILDYLLIHNIAPVNSFLVRSKVFEKIGLFNPSYKSLEDWEFWFRAAISGNRFSKVLDEETYAKIRVHSTSMSFNKHKMNLYLIRLQNDMVNGLKKKESKELMLVVKKNQLLMDKHFRRLIRNTGVLNCSQLSELADETNAKRFIKLYSRELLRALLFWKK